MLLMSAIVEFIEILLHVSQDCQFPFPFFIIGRAENYIVQRLLPPESQSLIFDVALQEFDASVDIRTFLRGRFSSIFRQNPCVMHGVQ
jgi:hypothetical protein